MFGTLGSLIQEPISVTGEQLIKYAYAAVTRKQRNIGYPTRCCLLTCNSVWCPHLLDLYDSIRNLEAYGKLTTSLSVFLLYDHPSEPLQPGPMTGHYRVHYKRDRFANLKRLAVRSLTALSPKDLTYSATQLQLQTSPP